MSGQFDGDGPFSKSMQALPAFFGGSPPWHLWGNTQQIETTVALPATVTNTAENPGVGQLVKVSHKRPTGWNWVFSSKLISGPTSGFAGGGGTNLGISVSFELSIGIGRSVIRMVSEGIQPLFGQFSPSFERHTFAYGAGFPTNAQIWSTKTISPSRTYYDVNLVGPAPLPPDPPTVIDTIIAQDIQLFTRVLAVADAGNFALGSKLVVEVSAQFSPIVHVRPDWYSERPDEVRFSGDEIGGT